MIHFESQSGAVLEQVEWCNAEEIFAQISGKTGAVWLDSQGDQQLARASFISFDPFSWVEEDSPSPLDHVKKLMASYTDPWSDLPEDIGAALPVFRGGLIGVFNYEIGTTLETLPLLEPFTIAQQTLPLLTYGLYGSLMAFDHLSHRCFVLATGLPAHGQSNRLARAREQLATWHRLIDRARALPTPKRPPPAQISSNFSPSAYQKAVQDIIGHICAGDIFQANLSQSFSGHFTQDYPSFDLYRRLRAISPAPFGGYFRGEHWSLLSSSPERFLSSNGELVSARPIKGTAPRSGDPYIDRRSALHLLESEKDRAENIMIVDLLRNDLARVCDDDSIRVPELCSLESHAQVHHLVSTITGRLGKTMSAADILKACFPGGSITGAPKIRAMEIISAFEAQPRGPYCGCLGYIGFDNQMDMNILIRSLVMSGPQFRFQVGGGITARSMPDIEYRETLDKAAGLFSALAIDPGQADRAVS